MEPKTTQQVAAELGLSSRVVIHYLRDHPELKPAKQAYKNGPFLWTDKGIAALRKARAWHKTTWPKQ
jgi:hypothetical protein